MPWVAAVVAVAAPIIANIAGQAQSAGDRASSREASDRAYKEMMSLGLPPDLSKQLILKEFKKVGILDPELEHHINLGASKVAQIQSDPKLRAQQTQGLDQLKQISRGGLRPEDRAALNQIRATTAQDEQGKLAQIEQNMQARGMAGSGNELAMALSSAQGGANRESRESDQLAAQSSQRALDALMKGTTMAGDVRAQDFSENKAKATAEDEFNRFNVQAQQAQQQRNVGARNQAQQGNLQVEQGLANANVNQANAETERQSAAKRQYYNDMMIRAGKRADAERAVATDFAGRAGATQAANASYGAAVASIANKFGGGMGAAAPSASAGVPGVGGGGGTSMPQPMAHGGPVQGHATLPDDSLENDTQHTILSPDEIVIPRSITTHHDAPAHAASFVAGVLAAKHSRRHN